MRILREIKNRRSIRKYKEKAVSQKDITDILAGAALAPSSKNRQPWKFVVVQGKSKKAMLDSFLKGIEREESGDAILPESRQFINSARNTVRIMEQAPVTIFVLNTLGKRILKELSAEERIAEICNIQSVSAAIQNIMLEAEHKGLGSLWICDIFFAYKELSEWLNEDGELIAAVSIGYPAESPYPRPRKNISEVTVWKD